MNPARQDIFWGVDLSTTRVDIGWARADGALRGSICATWDPRLNGGARLEACRHATYSTARALAHERPAACAFVEQPSGASGKPELVYIAGVVQAGIWLALHDHWDRDVVVFTVPPATWKKQVLGRGDYGKPKKNDDFTYQAIIWAQANGYTGDDDNVADSYCIAEHARQVVSFAAQ